MESNAVPEGWINGKGVAGSTGGNQEGLLGAVSHLEKEQIETVLRRYGFVKTRAARALGITPRQLRYRMMKYGIEDELP